MASVSGIYEKEGSKAEKIFDSLTTENIYFAGIIFQQKSVLNGFDVDKC